MFFNKHGIIILCKGFVQNTKDAEKFGGYK